MKSGTRTTSKLPEWLLLALFLALAPAALASNIRYVDGVNGNDNNDCNTAQTACQTISHAISLASSHDSIMVAAATYTENLTISLPLKVIGSDANTTVINGGGVNTVVTIPNASAHVSLSNVTITNGSARVGAGIYNSGKLTINRSTITGNKAKDIGGGIYNEGTLTINRSTISGNGSPEADQPYNGGGIRNVGTLMINSSTISGNHAHAGGGIFDGKMVTINNSTISGNDAGFGGGILFDGPSAGTINNSTISGNIASQGGILTTGRPSITVQNTIVANNSGGNCYYWGPIVSNGYNLDSDGTCEFNNTGDLNNTDPKLGKLRNNGGPTETIRLLPGSPAMDAGNPNGCTDDQGHLLKTDQRGWARPGKKDTGGCDMGAFERQKD